MSVIQAVVSRSSSLFLNSGLPISGARRSMGRRFLTWGSIENIDLSNKVSIAQLKQIACGNYPSGIHLPQDRLDSIERGERQLIQAKNVYGKDVGFGVNADQVVSSFVSDHETQMGLIGSHSVGIDSGKIIPQSKVYHMMLSRLVAMTFPGAYTAVSTNVVIFLHSLLEHQIIPIVPERETVSASGDLGPQAKLFDILWKGQGDAFYQGRVWPVQEIYNKLDITPPNLKGIDGLVLINGVGRATAEVVETVIKIENYQRKFQIVLGWY